MSRKIYYFVLKNYKGRIQKVHKGNTHLFMIPINPKKYTYLILIGKSEDEENVYYAHELARIPEDILENLINGEKEYFGDRFVEVESLYCRTTDQAPGHYLIYLPTTGINLFSNLEIQFQLDYSSNTRKIYSIRGELNLVSGEINEKEIGMIVNKQIAFMGDVKRFKEIQKINKKGVWYHE